MRRPFLGVLIAYASGVGLGERFEVPLPLLFAANFVLLGGLILVSMPPRFRPESDEASLPASRVSAFLLASLWIGCGWLNHLRHQAGHSTHGLHEVVGEVPVLAQVQGRLAATPEQRAVQTDAGLLWRSRATIELESIRIGEFWYPVSGRVWTTVSEVLDTRYYRGCRVRVSGVVMRPAAASAPGLFDYQSFLARRGIHYLLATNSSHDWQRVEDREATSPPLSDRFLGWARRTLALGLPEEDPATFLRWAMLLGWRGVLTDDLRSPFLHSGTMHVFAISGLHVSLVAGAWLAFLRLLRVPRAWSGLILVPVLWSYAGLTGWQPSAVRATVMMSVVVVGWALRRPVDLLNSLACAAVLILLWDPRQLFQPGFQLSFGVVLSLATLTPVVWRLGSRWFEPEPWLPAPLRSPFQEQWHRWARRGLNAFGVSCAAWLGSLPLVVWYFNLVTPVCVLVNLAVVPLAWAVVLSGLCSLTCGGWWVWACECFNHSGWLAMRLLISLSTHAGEWPGAWWSVARPSWWAVVGYYGLLAWPLIVGWKRSGQTAWILAALALLAGGLFGPSLLRKNALELAVLPAGGGDSLWADFPGRAQDTLLDTGDERSLEWTVSPFLQRKGLRHVPRLILSHGDVRHVGGVPTMLKDFTIGEVWVSGFNARSAAYRQAVSELSAQSRGVRSVGRGYESDAWRVLHPRQGDALTRADDQALVLLLEWEGARILLVSDLGRIGQNHLAEREPLLRVDVVVAGLPSTGEEALQDFLLDSLDPHAIVLSNADPRGGPMGSRELHIRLSRRAIPVFNTGAQGAIVIRVDRGVIEVEAMDGARLVLSPRGNSE